MKVQTGSNAVWDEEGVAEVPEFDAQLLQSLEQRRLLRNASAKACVTVVSRHDVLHGLFSFNIHQCYERHFEILPCKRVHWHDHKEQ